MRLRRLELRRFGRFADAVLDFAGITGDARGLHVVYGPNEAGKSTTLDAIRYSLYGMPSGSSKEPSYDFLHAKKDIRTALSIELDDGSLLEFARNRARDVSVLDIDSDAADPALADRVASALSGVPKELWVTRHGLSQSALRDGAEALLGGGSSSEALFAAATGMVGAYGVLDDIRAQRQSYLKDSGRGGLVSDAISDLKAAATEFQRARRETGAYDELASQLRDVRRDTEVARRAHAGAVAAVDVLARVSDARALLVQRDELVAARDAIPVELAHWDAGTYERFAAAQALVERTAGPIASRTAQLETLRAKLAQLTVDPGVLAVSGAVDDLHQRIAVVTAALQRIASAESSTAFDESALAQLDASVVKLEAAIAAARAIDHVALDRDRARLEHDRSELDVQAARIDPSLSDATAAARVVVPHAATREGVAAELNASGAERIALIDRVADAGGELERARDALEALRRGGREIPDRSVLAELRVDRDVAWQQLRAELGVSRDQLLAAADDVSGASARADQYTDRLLDDAEHVAAITSAQADVQRAHVRLEELERQGAELGERHAVLDARWRELWASTGWIVGDVVTMNARVEALEGVLARRTELEERGVELAARMTQLDRARTTLGQLVAANEEWDLPAVLELAGSRLTSDRAAVQVQTDRRTAHEARRLAHATIDAFVADLQRVATQIEAHVDVRLDASDPVSAVVALRELVRVRQADARAAAELEERLRDGEQELDALRSEHAGATAVLDELVQAARCEDVASLVARAGSWQQRAALDAQVREVEQSVLERAKMTSAELLEQLDGADEAELAQRRAEASAAATIAADELARLDALRSDLDQRLGAIRRDEAQAAARIRLQDVRAEVDRLVPIYRQLVLQERLLQSMLEDVAQQQRGPLLERASTYVAQLTGGEWTRLLTGIDDSGTSQAQLERAADGRAVAIADLSEGTRDQLYLALRLAVLVDSAARGERMPFIVDDVLMTFDDTRAAAALQLLADVSSEFQVIFLTHHEHLVELATNVLASDVLRVHRLDQLTTSPAALI